MKINKNILEFIAYGYDPFSYRNDGGFIANNRQDVYDFIDKYSENNIILKYNEYEIRWIDKNGCRWT